MLLKARCLAGVLPDSRKPRYYTHTARRYSPWQRNTFDLNMFHSDNPINCKFPKKMGAALGIQQAGLLARESEFRIRRRLLHKRAQTQAIVVTTFS